MPGSTKYARRIGWASTVIILIAVSVIAWSYRNITEVDINSGQIRSTTEIVGCSLSRHVKATWLSRNVPSPLGAASWKTVGSFPLFSRVSRRYNFGGAEAQIGKLEVLCERLVRITNDAKQFLATELLHRWQSDDDFNAGLYISFLSDQFFIFRNDRGLRILTNEEVKDILQNQ